MLNITQLSTNHKNNLPDICLNIREFYLNFLFFYECSVPSVRQFIETYKTFPKTFAVKSVN